jgi:hypothetical protein
MIKLRACVDAKQGLQTYHSTFYGTRVLTYPGPSSCHALATHAQVLAASVYWLQPLLYSNPTSADLLLRL